MNNIVGTVISSDGIECTNPKNINSIRAVSVGIDGDISFNNNNMESNNYSVYKASDLIFQTSVNVPKGYLINYKNIDGTDSFKCTLDKNDRIEHFILSVYDQDGNTITDMTESDRLYNSHPIIINEKVNKKYFQNL